MADIKRRAFDPNLPAAGTIDVGQQLGIGLTRDFGQHWRSEQSRNAAERTNRRRCAAVWR